MPDNKKQDTLTFMKQLGNKFVNNATKNIKKGMIHLTKKQTQDLYSFLSSYHEKFKQYYAELHKRYYAQANPRASSEAQAGYKTENSQALAADSTTNPSGTILDKPTAEKKLAIEDKPDNFRVDSASTLSAAASTPNSVSTDSNYTTQFPDPEIASKEGELLAKELAARDRLPVVSKIDQLVNFSRDPQWVQEYVSKVNADAKAMFGERLEATTSDNIRKMEETSLLNPQQVQQVVDFLEFHKQKIADWFVDKEDDRLLDTSEELRNAGTPTDILRIGAKAEQRYSQFQAGELPRSIELHKHGDELHIYITPSKKLASGAKAEALARGGAFKKVTNMIWLNPTNLKQRLLDMVTKSQSKQDEIDAELALEQKAYGDHATVMGLEYPSKGQLKVRTTEPAAVCDMLNYVADSSCQQRFIELDSRYDTNNHSASVDLINESLLGDCLQCLEKIHAVDIVHRDIKLENILIFVENGQLRARVTDFGLSEDMSAPNAEGNILNGTPDYFSPQHVIMKWCLHTGIIPSNYSTEVLAADARRFNAQNFYGKIGAYNWMQEHLNNSNNSDKFDPYMSSPKDDMWALGITMFRLITKRDPIHMSIDDAAKAYPLISKHKQLLENLLSVDREQRPDAKTALAMLQNPGLKQKP